MTPTIMPYRGNLDQTRDAANDVCAQTVDTPLLLIAQGLPVLDKLYPEIQQWAFDPPLPSLAAVWNRALRYAWESGAEAAWVVNNDVRLHPQTLEALLLVQRETGAWFVTASNVGEEAWPACRSLPELLPYDDQFLQMRGGPDFSCFLITRECHRWFQFDERFQPAYHEDNDYHRRLELAGFGDKIFSVSIPYLHYGSGTLKADPKLREVWDAKFHRSQQAYVEKWGGLPGHETYAWPFDLQGFGSRAGAIGVEYVPNLRVILTGQGTPQNWLPASAELFGG